MEEEILEKPLQNAFSVVDFRPEDAEGIVSLFRAVYGDSYPIRLFYNPEEIIAVNRDGRYRSFVARTEENRVIGVAHLFPSAPYGGLYENGVSLVHQNYRKSKAFRELNTYIIDDYIPRHPDIEVLWGESVCNHVISQKMAFVFHTIETALEIALMPAETYAQEQSSRGRVAALNSFRCYVSRPHQIFIPKVYQDILQRIYSRLDDRRDFAAAGERLPADVQTQIRMNVFNEASVARMTVVQSGRDFAFVLAEQEQQARKQNAVVFQIRLKLSEPSVGHAVDILKSQGYFFGGVLPRWFDSDGLLMQKLDCPPDFDRIMLWSDFAKDLLEFIRKDREVSID
jgi:hypothetical protein